MTVSGAGLDASNPFAVRVQKIAQDQAKQQGAQEVQQIEQSAPPVGIHGEGSYIDTIA
ncbi:MAG TPA: hypothetical protein VFK02_13990 [Kofleriaceae bacterium]|nr:hypothetical protein [Kofleriaceae bacterium]